ncbi:MAG: AraC family ligand binding domain-containing protein, partial [Lachnospiraceae bacterium]|nr:AraC family ligand binding domain-containing protein [Lachnospiraceae bacterium]
MELIEYEQVIPESNCFCKVFHSRLIETEKQLNTSRPLPHWHSSYEFNVCINGKLENHIGNEVCLIESEEFVLINPNVVHTSYEVTEDYLGFAVLIPEEYIRIYWRNRKREALLL